MFLYSFFWLDIITAYDHMLQCIILLYIGSCLFDGTLLLAQSRFVCLDVVKLSVSLGVGVLLVQFVVLIELYV